MVNGPLFFCVTNSTYCRAVTHTAISLVHLVDRFMGSKKNTMIYITGCTVTENSTVHIPQDFSILLFQGLKKVQSGCLGLVDSPSGLASRLSTESLKEQTKTCQGKQYLRQSCPRGKLEFKFFQALYSVTSTSQFPIQSFPC